MSARLLSLMADPKGAVFAVFKVGEITQTHKGHKGHEECGFSLLRLVEFACK